LEDTHNVFHDVIACKIYVFADSQRCSLLFPIIDYVPAVLTRFLAACDCKPQEMVLIIIDISCPWWQTTLEHRLPKPLRCIRDVRVLVRFPYQWCLHHYNCLLFIIILPVTDVHVMLKKIKGERRVWSTKYSQGKT